MPLPPAACDRSERLRVIEAAHTLGVPRDYGSDHRLRIVREPRELACIGIDIHGRHQWLTRRACAYDVGAPGCADRRFSRRPSRPVGD
ncbi:MAG: hypothetical protein IPP82_15540 [Xanthomonadales bacterium]|nr:hypothetical protein [Xanthomonadales bacterium]